jgi:hypothetical protein
MRARACVCVYCYFINNISESCRERDDKITMTMLSIQIHV